MRARSLVLKARSLHQQDSLKLRLRAATQALGPPHSGQLCRGAGRVGDALFTFAFTNRFKVV